MESRNNSTRLSVPEPSDPDAAQTDIPTQQEPAQQDTNKNSLLNFIRPTEFVELPTEGRFYPEGHPLHGQDSVEINMMTAKEEDILTNRSLIKKGVALDRMVRSLLIDKRINVKDLFLGDKNAIIVTARISAYGPEYKASITCPSCNTAETYEIDLEEVLADSEGFQMPDGVEMNHRNNFIIELPKTGISAEVRLLNGHDSIEDTKKNKSMGLIDMFKKFVVSLNEITDRKQVDEFLELMPASDSKILRQKYGELVPNVDMDLSFECNTCDHEQTMEVPLSADFFWPGS